MDVSVPVFADFLVSIPSSLKLSYHKYVAH